MADRADEFRKAAAQCLALARNSRDPSTRAMLLFLAQKWREHADNPTADIRFDAILKEFNDQQMSKLLGISVPPDICSTGACAPWRSHREHCRKSPAPA